MGAMKTKTVKLEMETMPGFNFQHLAPLGKQKESQGKHPEVPGSGSGAKR